MREENFLGCAQIYRQEERFWKIFGGFLQFFYNFLENFYNFFGIFCNFFGKFSQNFLQFFSTFAISQQFFRKFFRKFSLTIRYGSTGVQPRSRHYCKFTSKFTSRITPKFTLILIKILQSTKFEGSHFHNLLATFSTTNRFSQFLIPFRNLLRPPKTLLLAAAFSQPQLRRAKGTNGRPSPCDGGGMWAIRGIISRITSLIVSRLTSQRPGRKPTKNRGKTEAPFAFPLPQVPLPLREKVSKYL